MKTLDFAAAIRARMAQDPDFAKQVEEAVADACAGLDIYANLVAQLAECPHCRQWVDFDDDPNDAFRHNLGFAIICGRCNSRFCSFANETPASVVERWNQRA